MGNFYKSPLWLAEIPILAGETQLGQERIYIFVIGLVLAGIAAAILLAWPQPVKGSQLEARWLGFGRRLKHIAAEPQGSIIAIGLLIFVAAGLFPPWFESFSSASHRDKGFDFIFLPPSADARLDTTRLFVERVCIMAATGAAWLVLGWKPPSERSVELTKSNAAESAFSVMPKTVTIIDDDSDMIELYKLSLCAWFPQVKVIQFSDGTEGWHWLEYNNPDLLIMDINRTGMNGIETLGRLAALNKTYPIFVASGCLSADVEKLARAAAGPLRVALHPKPWTAEQLRGEISQLLGPG